METSMIEVKVGCSRHESLHTSYVSWRGGGFDALFLTMSVWYQTGAGWLYEVRDGPSWYMVKNYIYQFRAIVHNSSACGLVVKSVVAIDGPRVRFAACAELHKNFCPSPKLLSYRACTEALIFCYLDFSYKSRRGNPLMIVATINGWQLLKTITTWGCM